MAAYYNEHDPFAAAWLRGLISENLIAPGEVDERDVEDVRPDELRPFRQCHFFAGIGIWSLALRQAGYPDDRQVWTGSCPCQPFSEAGKGAGFTDERHLWPAFFHLIGERQPSVVFGEQVANRGGLAWLDLVQADMEGAGYAFGAVDTCVAGFGGPHIRQRLYFVGLADAVCARLPFRQITDDRRGTVRVEGAPIGADSVPSGVEYSGRKRRQRRQAPTPRNDDDGPTPERPESQYGPGLASTPGVYRDAPGPVNGLWRDADWIFCKDRKWRPVSPGTFPLAASGTLRNRVGALRGSGNSLTLAQAEAFVRAVFD